MKRQKQLFFKTVRSDGSSVWAPPGLGRVYEIGKTYRFPKWAPAWLWSYQPMNRLVFSWRPESNAGNRVLICWGFVSLFDAAMIPVACFDTAESVTGFEYRYGSTYFTVVGEVFVPSDWRTAEHPKQCVLTFRRHYIFKENYSKL